jgi:hypothetical protein
MKVVEEERSMIKELDVAEKPRAPGVQPPMVYVYEDTAWEYKRLCRDLAHEDLPTEEEMNTLGAKGWELAGVVSRADKVYFYLKRIRK